MEHDHASRLVAGWAADPHAPPWRRIHGTAVLADLSGFTRLTELLERRREEGPEAMHDVMTACFGALLSRSVELGGDVIGFAGDAALVWFDGDGHAARAVAAAGRMPADLGALPAALTGGRRLRVSVGVHTGTVDAVLTRTEQRGLFLCGPEVSLLTSLQTDAGKDQVLVSPTTAAAVPGLRLGGAIGAGHLLRGRPPASGFAASTLVLDDEGATRSRSVLGPAVRTLLDAGVAAADHRTVTVGFLRAHGTDALAAAGPERLTEALECIAGTVVRVGRELSVEWLDTDLGVDSVKLLLTAGAPRAVTHDEQRMLLALRRIVDECEVPLRAGVQRGHVFAALLGVPGRRSYTVLSDAANVAARCLGKAEDGDVVAGDALGLPELPGVAATSLGIAHFKNRVQPMQIWRVHRVEGIRTRSGMADSPLAGMRHVERRQLAEMWKHTVDGEGRAVALVGDPGMGASALLLDLVDLAGGAATLVTGDPFRRHVPYSVVHDIVQELATAAGHEGDPWAVLSSRITGLAPHLREWAPDALATVRGDADDSLDPRTRSNRTRLVLAALLADAAPSPWLLGVDDLDEIDEASRSVLAGLLAFTATRPFMLASAGVPGGAALSDPFVSSTTITLGPVHEDDARAAVVDAAPLLRDDQVDAVVTAAKGNPFVLLELARHHTGGELPDSLRRIGAIRVDELPPVARALARDAAVLGSSWTIGEAAAALERPELLDPSEWAAVHTVITAAPDGTMSFRHEAYRDAAYRSIPHRRRRALHAAIADHLEHTGAPPALLALHHEGAGRLERALHHARASAAAARSAGATRDATELYARAVALARRTGAPDVASLLTDLGDVSMWLGDLHASDRALRSAASVAAEPGTLARIHHLRANLGISLGRLTAARRQVERGEALAAEHGLDSLLAQLVLDRSTLLSYLGKLDESAAVAEEGLAIAERADDRLGVGLGHLYAEMAYSMLMDERAVPHGEAAVRTFEELGHDRYLAGALNNHGLTLMHLGRWDDAIDRYEAAAALATRAGRPIDRAMVEMNVGYIRYRQGRLDDARVAAVRTRRVFDTVHQEQMGGMARMLLALVAAAEGRFDEAAESLTESRACFERVGDTPMTLDCDVVALEHLLLAGRADEVVAAAVALDRRMDVAELPVRVALQRIVGEAEAAGGDMAGGRERIGTAAALARRHRLGYDEYLCLDALSRLGDEAADRAAAEMATQFGLRRSP